MILERHFCLWWASRCGGGSGCGTLHCSRRCRRSRRGMEGGMGGGGALICFALLALPHN